jgi:hypothetical protein
MVFVLRLDTVIEEEGYTRRYIGIYSVTVQYDKDCPLRRCMLETLLAHQPVLCDAVNTEKGVKGVH